MSRWDNAKDSYLSRLNNPDLIWVEYFVLDPIHPYETIVGIVLEDLPDSLIVAFPSHPLVELRTSDESPPQLQAFAEVAQLPGVFRLYKSTILYSNDAPAEIKLAYYRLLLDEEPEGLSDMLKKSPAHKRYKKDMPDTLAYIQQTADILEAECKLNPDVFSDEGRSRILEAVDLEDDFVEEDDNERTLH